MSPKNDNLQPDLFDLLIPEKKPEAKVAPLPEPVTVVEKPKGPTVYSVTALSTNLRDTLRTQYGEVLVQGEIADFKGVHRSGHLYFALKDENSQIRAVMWRGAVAKLPFEVKQGLEVIVTAKIDFYGGGGSLQLNVERMEPVGLGALQLRFEQLKEKLTAEGLFDLGKKRKVSPINYRIGLVTGRSTAALQDMLKVIRSRFPIAEVYLFHAAVQGESAPLEVERAIALANRYSSSRSQPLDVLVVARGGGSYEDLFCFNDEKIVRAIAASRVPVVSAIGHEIDVTLADFAADRRSATPSHAAQEIVPESRLWLVRLEELGARLQTRMMDRLRDARLRLDAMESKLRGASPERKLEQQKRMFADRGRVLELLMRQRLQSRRDQLSRLAQTLDALSPLRVLDRGYGLILDAKGAAVTSVKSLSQPTIIQLRLSDGTKRGQFSPE